MSVGHTPFDGKEIFGWKNVFHFFNMEKIGREIWDIVIVSTTLTDWEINSQFVP